MASGARHRFGSPAPGREIYYRKRRRRFALPAHSIKLLLNRQVLHKAPVAAGVNLNIPNALPGDDCVCLIPERHDWHVAANDLLNLRVELFRLFAIEGVNCFPDQRVEFLVAVATTIS